MYLIDQPDQHSRLRTITACVRQNALDAHTDQYPDSPDWDHATGLAASLERKWNDDGTPKYTLIQLFQRLDNARDWTSWGDDHADHEQGGIEAGLSILIDICMGVCRECGEPLDLESSVNHQGYYFNCDHCQQQEFESGEWIEQHRDDPVDEY